MEHWPQPEALKPHPEQGRLDLRLNGGTSFRMTDWSFSQLCKLAGVSKDTVNHIVWDAVEVVDFSRKHTANVYESVADIRGIIARLVEKRDERRDGFVQVVKKAMETRLGSNSDEVLKVLAKQGITRMLAKEALEVARSHGAFTIFAVVDALTRISGKLANAGERSEVDQKASALLSLAK